VSDNAPSGWEAIDRIRRKIDEIDRRLLELLNARARCVAEVGEVKKRTGGMPLYQPDREREIFEAMESANTGPLSDRAIRRLFELILDESRAVERSVMGTAASEPSRPGEAEEP
jgi:chorismate mutase